MIRVVFVNLPPFSIPTRFPTGTLTFSKTIKVVPDPLIPEHCIFLVVTPGPRSITSNETPSVPGPPVRT